MTTSAGGRQRSWGRRRSDVLTPPARSPRATVTLVGRQGASLELTAMSRCRDCGHACIENEGDGPVCTNCGTLQVLTHTRLVSVEEQIAEQGNFIRQHPVLERPLTLKSARRDGWDLSGQSSHGRNERNMVRLISFSSRAYTHPCNSDLYERNAGDPG